MRYVIGIDAGGTKTHAILADETGCVVAETRGPGANVSTAGELVVERVLRQVIGEAVGTRGVTPAAIGLGMAGAERPEDHRILGAVMRRVAPDARTVIANDALVALAAGAGSGPGIVLVAGTGSIAFGRNARNQAARAGGWGIPPRRRGQRILDWVQGVVGRDEGLGRPRCGDDADAGHPRALERGGADRDRAGRLWSRVDACGDRGPRAARRERRRRGRRRGGGYPVACVGGAGHRRLLGRPTSWDVGGDVPDPAVRRRVRALPARGRGE